MVFQLNCVEVVVEVPQLTEGDSIGSMVTVTVTVQPLASVYVMSDVPLVTPVTKPEASTVATPVSEEIQGAVAFAVPLPVNCVVAPKQALKVPVIVGVAFIVTVSVTTQPVSLVYVISAVPLVTPDTNPVPSTVATAVSEETHGDVALAVPSPVNCVVSPSQALYVPVIVGTVTATVTVTVQSLAIAMIPPAISRAELIVI